MDGLLDDGREKFLIHGVASAIGVDAVFEEREIHGLIWVAEGCAGWNADDAGVVGEHVGDGLIEIGVLLGDVFDLIGVATDLHGEGFGDDDFDFWVGAVDAFYDDLDTFGGAFYREIGLHNVVRSAEKDDGFGLDGEYVVGEAVEHSA